MFFLCFPQGTLPFEGDTEEEIEEKILSGGFDLPDDIRERISGKGIDLLKKFLTYAPSLRVSASQALQHPWFNDVKQREKINAKTQERTTIYSVVVIVLLDK